jgi:hypothetical protein
MPRRWRRKGDDASQRFARAAWRRPSSRIVCHKCRLRARAQTGGNGDIICAKKRVDLAFPSHTRASDKIDIQGQGSAPDAERARVDRLGPISNFVRGVGFDHQTTNLSPNRMANWVLASYHSRGGRFHSSTARLRTRYTASERVHDAQPELGPFGLFDPEAEDFLGPIWQNTKRQIKHFQAKWLHLAAWNWCHPPRHGQA